MTVHKKSVSDVVGEIMEESLSPMIEGIKGSPRLK